MSSDLTVCVLALYCLRPNFTLAGGRDGFEFFFFVTFLYSKGKSWKLNMFCPSVPVVCTLKTYAVAPSL